MNNDRRSSQIAMLAKELEAARDLMVEASNQDDQEAARELMVEASNQVGRVSSELAMMAANQEGRELGS